MMTVMAVNFSKTAGVVLENPTHWPTAEPAGTSALERKQLALLFSDGEDDDDKKQE